MLDNHGRITNINTYSLLFSYLVSLSDKTCELVKKRQSNFVAENTEQISFF